MRHEDRFGLGVALLNEEHFGLENLADDVGVAAVDDQLDALAHELVVELRGLVLERQQTFAARLLGERHQVGDDLALVVLRLGERIAKPVRMPRMNVFIGNEIIVAAMVPPKTRMNAS